MAIFDTSIGDIIAPIGAFLGLCVSSVGVLFVKEWLAKRQNKIAANAETFALRLTMSAVSDIYLRIYDLVNSTKIDRFLVLRAENGQTMLKTATVELEHPPQKSIYATFFYKNVPIDDTYREMLKMAEASGVYEMETAKMPDCKLRGYYEDEGVTFSNCYFIGRLVFSDKKAIVFYCTAATHQNEPFTPQEERKIEKLVESLKQEVAKELENMAKVLDLKDKESN
jgi:hypothetical protein